MLFYSLNAVFHFSFLDGPIDQAGIAIVHTTFNLLCTMLLLPFAGSLERLACATIKDEPKTGGGEVQLLDERLMVTPPVAIAQAKKLTIRMAELSRDSMERAMSMVEKYDPEGADFILQTEDQIDSYEDRLGTYLVKLAAQSLSEADSREVSKMLHTIGDFERISDHACSTLKAAEEMEEKKIHFSEDAQSELRVIGAALKEVLDMTVESFSKEDLATAEQVEPLEQVIDYLKDQMKNRHIGRLQEGACTIELGFIFSDLLTNYERVSDHCSNVAAYMIELKHGSVDTHRYLDGVKSGDNRGFLDQYDQYMKKYALS